MAYQVLQKRRFSRQYKKLQNNVIVDVDAAIEKIAQSPKLGERKKGIWQIFLSINSTVKASSTSLDTPLIMVFASFI